MSKLLPCKKCGSMPTLYQPSWSEVEQYQGILQRQNPEPYYRCENCRMLAEVEKNNRIAEDWNRQNQPKKLRN